MPEQGLDDVDQFKADEDPWSDGLGIRRLDHVAIEWEEEEWDEWEEEEWDEWEESEWDEYEEDFLTYGDLYNMFVENAGDICYDPRHSGEEEHDGVWSAFTETWFFFDTDANGFIEAHDVRNAFATMDFFANGQINKQAVESVTDGFALELCFESAIVSDEEMDDSDCEWDEDDWVMRKRRCGPEETTFWNPRGRSLKHESGGLFDLMD